MLAEHLFCCLYLFPSSLHRSTIRDKIIPHAVSWFTGEAAQDEFGDMDGDEDGDIEEDDEEDDDEEDEDEDDEEDDEDEEDQPKYRKKVS